MYGYFLLFSLPFVHFLAAGFAGESMILNAKLYRTFLQKEDIVGLFLLSISDMSTFYVLTDIFFWVFRFIRH